MKEFTLSKCRHSNAGMARETTSRSSKVLFATRRLDLLSTLQLISFYTKATFAPI